MIEIEIRDFQSIDHVAVRIDGFTAIVGRSNIGKSAIVRAVKSALTGAPAESFVRHGSQCLRRVKDTKTCKCFCQVAIKAPGFDLLWEKGDAVNRYVFNGKEYTAASRGTPDFLENTVGLVKIGDSKELLQVSDQFNPLFLLDKSGTVVADVLSDVAHLDQINVATRLVEKDRKESVASRKIRDKDILDLKVRVASYDGLDEAVTCVQAVERAQQGVREARLKVSLLDEHITNLFSLGRDIKALEKANAVAVPDKASVDTKYAEFDRLRRFLSAILERDSVLRSLVSVESLVLPDDKPLREAAYRFARLDSWIARTRGLKEPLVRWAALDKVACPEPEPLAEAAARYQKLASLAPRYKTAVEALAGFEAALGQVTAELASVQSEIDVIGVCPTCTQPFATSSHDHAGVGGL